MRRLPERRNDLLACGLDAVLTWLERLRFDQPALAYLESIPLRQRVPYRTKIDRGADGILGAGTTPLLRAAKTGDAKVVRLLREHGANPLAAVGRG